VPGFATRGLGKRSGASGQHPGRPVSFLRVRVAIRGGGILSRGLGKGKNALGSLEMVSDA
jgi:hypothetical protein